MEMSTACHSLARFPGLLIKSTPLTLASQIVRNAMPASLHLLSTSPQRSLAILGVFHVTRGGNLDFWLQQEVNTLSGVLIFQTFSSLSLYDTFGLLLMRYPFYRELC